jgi:hypothetical protein
LTYVVLQYRGLRTTPVARNIVVDEGVQFNAIKGERLTSQGNLRQVGAEVGVELVPVDADVGGRITHAQQSRRYLRGAQLGRCGRLQSLSGLCLVHG